MVVSRRAISKESGLLWSVGIGASLFDIVGISIPRVYTEYSYLIITDWTEQYVFQCQL